MSKRSRVVREEENEGLPDFSRALYDELGRRYKRAKSSITDYFSRKLKYARVKSNLVRVRGSQSESKRPPPRQASRARRDPASSNSNRYQGNSRRMPKRYRSSRKRPSRSLRSRKGRRSMKRRRFTRKGRSSRRGGYKKTSKRFKKKVQEIINCSSDQQYELFYDSGLFTNLNRLPSTTTGGSLALCWMLPDYDALGTWSGIPTFPSIRDVSFIANLHASGAAGTFKRIEIVSAYHETEFLNCGTHPFEMKIYFYVARTKYNIDSPWNTALHSLDEESKGAIATETAVNAAVTSASTFIYNLPIGLTPYMLPEFCQDYKILSTKTRIMRSGRPWRVKQRLRGCKRYSIEDFADNHQCLPHAVQMMVAIRGLPQTEAASGAATAAVKDGEATLAWLSHRKYNFSIFNTALPEVNIRTSSIIGGMTTASMKTWPTQIVETVAAPAFPGAAL
nr:MAG: capsid protein [Cressdnaviricota sp.]